MVLSGETLPFAINATEQTAGRGRDGRQWASPIGNLYLSLALPLAVGWLARAGELSFVTGVALHKSLIEIMNDEAGFKLKWPNDLLYNDKKIAGILLETSQRTINDNANSIVIIGIGLNLEHFPSGTPYPATSIKAEFGWTPSILQLIKILLTNFNLLIDDWQSNSFASIRRQWLQNAKGINQPISLQQASGAISGIFKGINDTGSLLLYHNNHIKEFSIGDVFFTS